MRKLTKRVQADGLWFDVSVHGNWICFDPDGQMVCFLGEEKPRSDWGVSCWQGDEKVYGCLVDLEGADWRECCWYVGDQADGEVAERREWMAKGVDTVASATKNLDAGDPLLNKVNSIIHQVCAAVAEKIRRGSHGN